MTLADDIAALTTDVDANYPNRTAGDQVHQQDHDRLHRFLRAFRDAGADQTELTAVLEGLLSGAYAPAASALATGFYYGAPAATLGTSTAMTQDLLTATPFWLPKATTFDRIAAEVTVAATGSTVRLGIYDTDADDARPGSLVLDAGTIDGASTGVMEVTISEALDAGLYWLAAVSQGGAPTVRIVSTVASPWTPTVLALGTLRSGFQQSGVTGALPASFTATPNVASSAHRVVVRAA